MHEYSLCQNIFETVMEVARNEGATKVKSATFETGPFALVVFEQVEFWWQEMIKETIAEGAPLIHKKAAGRLLCTECGEENDVHENNSPYLQEMALQVESIGLAIFKCPNCLSLQTKILSGREMRLTSVDLQIPEPQASS